MPDIMCTLGQTCITVGAVPTGMSVTETILIIVVLVLAWPIWVPVGYFLMMAIIAFVLTIIGGVIAGVVWLGITISDFAKPRREP